MACCLRIVPLLSFVVLPLGCSNDQKLAQVSGQVTMDDCPLGHAVVRFVPIGGGHLPSSVAVTDEDGHYELSVHLDGGRLGAVIGEYRVTISIDQRRGKIMPTNRPNVAEMLKLSGELLPSKYNRDSTLTCTVPPEGKTDANFALTSK